jgi:hypothetical protein
MIGQCCSSRFAERHTPESAISFGDKKLSLAYSILSKYFPGEMNLKAERS